MGPNGADRDDVACGGGGMSELTPEQRLFGLMEAAEADRAAVSRMIQAQQQDREALASERRALSHDRQVLEVTVRELPKLVQAMVARGMQSTASHATRRQAQVFGAGALAGAVLGAVAVTAVVLLWPEPVQQPAGQGVSALLQGGAGNSPSTAPRSRVSRAARRRRPEAAPSDGADQAGPGTGGQ